MYGRAYLLRLLGVLLAVSITFMLFHFRMPESARRGTEIYLYFGIGFAVVSVTGLILYFTLFHKPER